MNDMQRYLSRRFRGLLPIVIDVETGGVDCRTDALLEVAAVAVSFHPDQGWCHEAPDAVWHEHIIPFKGAHCCPEALALNHIVPDHPLRFAIEESEALNALATYVNRWKKITGCRRAVLVGHNAHFDLNFIMNAVSRHAIKQFPLHRFTCFDTATLGGVLYGETVLARLMWAAGLSFDPQQAHGALYDTQKTAELFCHMLNHCPPLTDFEAFDTIESE